MCITQQQSSLGASHNHFSDLTVKVSHPKWTKCSIKIQGSYEASWASKMFQTFPGFLEGKAQAEILTPSILQSWSFQTKQWGSLWASRACGEGGYNTHWVQDFKPQQRHLGSLAYVGGLKESPVGNFRIRMRPFRLPESTEFHLATGATLWIRYPRFWKQSHRNRPCDRNGKASPPLVSLLLFWWNVLLCLDFFVKPG